MSSHVLVETPIRKGKGASSMSIRSRFKYVIMVKHHLNGFIKVIRPCMINAISPMSSLISTILRSRSKAVTKWTSFAGLSFYKSRLNGKFSSWKPNGFRFRNLNKGTVLEEFVLLTWS